MTPKVAIHGTIPMKRFFMEKGVKGAKQGQIEPNGFKQGQPEPNEAKRDETGLNSAKQGQTLQNLTNLG